MSEEIHLGLCLAARERLEKRLVEWVRLGQMVLTYLELPDQMRQPLEKEIRLQLKLLGVRQQ